jgi:hypothetical protein
MAMKTARDRAYHPRYLLLLCELERIDRKPRNVKHRIQIVLFSQTKASTHSTSSLGRRLTNSWPNRARTPAVHSASKNGMGCQQFLQCAKKKPTQRQIVGTLMHA